MNGHSFTVGADHRVYAATMTGFRNGSSDTLRDIIVWGGTTMLEAAGQGGATGSVSRTGDTIVAIVRVDLERGAREWNVIDALGVFTGSFIINCSGGGELRIERESGRETLWSIK